jgi:hypothetical protein
VDLRGTVLEPLMFRLNPTVVNHSRLRILIVIGEIIIGLNRFKFKSYVTRELCKECYIAMKAPSVGRRLTLRYI